MDVCLVIKHRLEELDLEQRDLAAAAEVTESYISQLLTRRKLPPAPGRTDIYDKMGKFLKLPSGKRSLHHTRGVCREVLFEIHRGEARVHEKELHGNMEQPHTRSHRAHSYA